jgi:HemY protein
MIRLIAILITAGLIAATAAWFADHDGVLMLTIAGYEIRTSAGFAVLMMILLAALVLVVIQLVSFLFGGPSRIGAFFTGRRALHGYNALSRGLIAAAAGDTMEAANLARQSEKLLGVQPLALLLKAQAAQLAGNDERLDTVYRAMLDHPETEFLGLRGLYGLALRRHNEEQALSFATRAHALRPKAAGAASALFDLRVARQEWQEAQALVAQAARAKIISPDIARRRRGVLLAAEAVEDDRNGDAAALSHALEALGFAPSLTPAALIAARHLTREGRAWRAQDIIEAAWAQAPHPELAEAYAAIRPDDDRDSRAARMAGLANLNPNHRESRLILAEQAITTRHWSDARAALAPLAEEFAGVRVCSLMADLAQGEEDPMTAQIWRARAARAPRDAQWVCARCGWSSALWAPTCPSCRTFDAFSWGTRTSVTLDQTARESIASMQLPMPMPLGSDPGGVTIEGASRARLDAPSTVLRPSGNSTYLRAPDDPGPGGVTDMFEAGETERAPEEQSEPRG